MLPTIEELIEENKTLRRLAVCLLNARGGRIDIHMDIFKRLNPDDYDILIEESVRFQEVVVKTVCQS